MNDKPGFVAMYIDAAKMHENGIPFAVIIDNNTIKAYAVSKENWSLIEKDAELYIEAGNCQPLVYLNEAFIETAKQMGWLIVGGVR